MVRILGFHCRGLGSILGRGTKILQARQHGQKKTPEMPLILRLAILYTTKI